MIIHCHPHYHFRHSITISSKINVLYQKKPIVIAVPPNINSMGVTANVSILSLILRRAVCSFSSSFRDSEIQRLEKEDFFSQIFISVADGFRFRFYLILGGLYG